MKRTLVLLLLAATIYAVAACDSPCLNGGVCSLLSCTCPLGILGLTCETNVNECTPNPCANGVCLDGVNGYVCVCNPGFSGTNCELNVNECASLPCGQHGSCLDAVSGYFCVCDSGYSGSHCEIEVSIQIGVTVEACLSLNCGQNGYCSNGQCVCNPGFTGTNCQANLNDCTVEACGEHGACVDGVNAYLCVCETGWSGVDCSVSVTVTADLCASVVCGENQYCLNGVCEIVVQDNTGGGVVTDDDTYTPPPPPVFTYDYEDEDDTTTPPADSDDGVTVIPIGGELCAGEGVYTPTYPSTQCGVQCRWIGKAGCGSDDWCKANCNRSPQAYCPPEYCECDVNIIATVGEAGCADGTREGFTDRAMYPNIAACDGGWEVPSLHPSQKKTSCNRQAGNEWFCTTKGCSAADICAEGWHVCEHNADVMTCAGDAGGCHAGDYAHTGFYATRMSGNTNSKCHPNHGWSNDVFGCGNHGSDVDCKECKGLSKFSHNQCQNLDRSWNCQDGQKGTRESYSLTKRNYAYGGVMCCKDGVDRWGTSDDDTEAITFGPTCHGQTVHLSCPAGQVIHMLDAAFGRWDTLTCLPDGWDADRDGGYSATGWSTSTIAEANIRCEGKVSCSLWAHETTCGDGGDWAYLMGRYECWDIHEPDVCYYPPSPSPIPPPLEYDDEDKDYVDDDANVGGGGDKDKDKDKSDKDKDKDKDKHSWGGDNHDNDKSKANDGDKDAFGCVYNADSVTALAEFGPTCEGKTSKMCCPDGYIIEVVDVTYGRADYDTCPHRHSNRIGCGCDHKDYAVSQCNGKQFCSAKFDNGIKGDPCPGTYKYAHGHYRCRSASPEEDDSKVTICDEPDGDRKTKIVSPSDLPWYLGRGAALGKCNDSYVMRMCHTKKWRDLRYDTRAQTSFKTALYGELCAALNLPTNLMIYQALKLYEGYNGETWCDVDIHPHAYPSDYPFPSSILSNLRTQVGSSSSKYRKGSIGSTCYRIDDVSSEYNTPKPQKESRWRRTAYYCGGAAGGATACGAAVVIYRRRKQRLAKGQAVPTSEKIPVPSENVTLQAHV